MKIEKKDKVFFAFAVLNAITSCVRNYYWWDERSWDLVITGINGFVSIFGLYLIFLRKRIK